MPRPSHSTVLQTKRRFVLQLFHPDLPRSLFPNATSIMTSAVSQLSPVTHEDQNLERDRMAAVLQYYRGKVQTFNHQQLADAIEAAGVDPDSEDVDDIDLLLEENWTDDAITDSEFRGILSKVSDLYNQLGDGTRSFFPTQALQDERLLNLKQDLQLKHELQLPTQYEILLGLTGGLLGPGLPKEQASSMIAAVDGSLMELGKREEMIEICGLREDDGWEIETGWHCGAGENGGSSWIIYCRNSQDGFSTWGWRYFFKEQEDAPVIYDDLIAFIKGYIDMHTT